MFIKLPTVSRGDVYIIHTYFQVYMHMCFIILHIHSHWPLIPLTLYFVYRDPIIQFNLGLMLIVILFQTHSDINTQTLRNTVSNFTVQVQIPSQTLQTTRKSSICPVKTTTWAKHLPRSAHTYEQHTPSKNNIIYNLHSFLFREFSVDFLVVLQVLA